jgi:hypothetical protein
VHAEAGDHADRFRHKLALWDLPVEAVVFLDTDVALYEDAAKLAELHARVPAYVIMSPDMASGVNPNSGIMVLRPNPDDRDMVRACMSAPTFSPNRHGGDQQIISSCFAKRDRLRAAVGADAHHEPGRGGNRQPGQQGGDRPNLEGGLHPVRNPFRVAGVSIALQGPHERERAGGKVVRTAAAADVTHQ